MELSGNFLPEVAKARGLDKFGPYPVTVIADGEVAAVAKARSQCASSREGNNIDPESIFVVVRQSRPLRWAEMPLEAIEIHHTKSVSEGSMRGWKRRGFVAKQFPRSVRAGGASLRVYVVVSRRRT
jgi:hypothetical protein